MNTQSNHLPAADTFDLTGAAQMEAEEKSLIIDDGFAKQAENQIYEKEEKTAKSNAVSAIKQGAIYPKAELHTDDLSTCHEPTTADEMESEERDLVIADSVEAVRTFADKPLSDEEIRRRALTNEKSIHPNLNDPMAC
ncbi:hypothetical protein [Stenoxybacter acetivorans]|uniref:hypothetical protein n=1 Tax=Stenoxybacter acetivorans TaxID=422441 RepID=UPI000569BD79|nr:hypothetical protein [Stenoxybacter acetivorans]